MRISRKTVAAVWAVSVLGMMAASFFISLKESEPEYFLSGDVISLSQAQAEQASTPDQAAAESISQEKVKEGPADITNGGVTEESDKAPPPIAAIRERGSRGGEDCVSSLGLEDLKKRREELELRSSELESKDKELKQRERAMEEELKRIEGIRVEVAKLTGAIKKENEEKVAKLVETFEAMSPKASAQMLANIDEGLAVAAMSRMSTLKLSKVMNVMEPKRATRLTELLAGVISARAPSETSSNGESGRGGSNRKSVKGGEENDGHDQQSDSNSGSNAVEPKRNTSS